MLFLFIFELNEHIAKLCYKCVYDESCTTVPALGWTAKKKQKVKILLIAFSSYVIETV